MPSVVCYIEAVELRAAQARFGEAPSQAVMLSVMLSVLGSNQVDLGGFSGLDRLTRPGSKTFGFKQLQENKRARE